MIKKYMVFFLRDFLGFDEDFEHIISNQSQILEKISHLEKMEIDNANINAESSYYNYLTLKNLLYFLIFVGLIGSGVWLYNTDFLNSSILESIKGLGTLSKEFHSINLKTLLEALEKLNENSVNLSKEELKLLNEIRSLILQRGIAGNLNIQRPIDLSETEIVWGDS
jgi:hypothetical protein